MEEPQILTVLTTFLALFIDLLNLKYHGDQDTPFQEHPRIVHFALGALVMCLFLYGFEKKYPRFYQAYLRYVPLGVEFFGFLSVASTSSLLFPDFARPVVYFFCLVLPAVSILYWIFQKLKHHFAETRFWETRVIPVLCCLRERINLVFDQVGPEIVRAGFFLGFWVVFGCFSSYNNR
uniref:Uncharacterized protein n=1 Tax=Nicotiana tabacum TaxID=4097 RepID=A0A1S4CDG0_TOBAC|nr:PREDICTED: uncharacterized protein LOC107817788 [Nicotiana tabacum]